MEFEGIVCLSVEQVDWLIVRRWIRLSGTINFRAPAFDAPRECGQLASCNAKLKGKMVFVYQPLARLELLDPANNLEERHLRG